MPEFEAELEKMDRLAEESIQIEITDWEPRSVIYYMGRNVRHAEDGSFSSTNQPMSELIQRISQVTEEVRQGTRISNREKDVLTQALGRSRGRVEQEAEYLRRLKDMEDRMEARIEATVEARVKQILLSNGSVVAQNPTPTAFSP